MSKLLIDDNPIMVLPKLALLIGLPSAMCLQQIHFLCSIPHSGKLIDGHHYIWNTYEEWHDSYFPFWSIKTIQRAMEDLRKRNLIVVIKPDAKFNNHTMYYRVNVEAVERLTGQNVLTDLVKMSKSDLVKKSKSRHLDNLTKSLYRDTETPPESEGGPSKTSGNGERSPTGSLVKPLAMIVDDVQTVEQSYEQVVSKVSNTALAIWNAVVMKSALIAYICNRDNAEQVLSYAFGYAAYQVKEHEDDATPFTAAKAAATAYGMIRRYNGEHLPKFDPDPDFGETKPAFLKYVW